MGRPDVGAAVEVGNGAGHAQDAVVGAGREVETLHGRVQGPGDRSLTLTILLDEGI